MSNTTGFFPFMRCQPGQENCSLGHKGDQVDLVPLTTFDHILDMYKLAHVDLLKVRHLVGCWRLPA